MRQALSGPRVDVKRKRSSILLPVAVCLLSVGVLLGHYVRSNPLRAAPRRPASQLVSRAPHGAALFTDVAAPAHVVFQHRAGGGSPLNILQGMGSGCAMFDYDNDGWLDLYLVNSQGPSALFHNERNGTFTDVTERAGVANTGGYGIGCAVGDYNGDGRLDLYVTNYGSNLLYRNNGDGTFTDVARPARVAAGNWSTSAAFGDYDGDGWLDLYVAHYAVFLPGMGPLFCPVLRTKVLGSCSPAVYMGEPGVLYHNNGDGTFTDSTMPSGVWNMAGKGLGVLWLDENSDGRLDLFVANDLVANNLFRNLGGGKFRDVGTDVGVAYNAEGDLKGSMGVDAGDYDNDGQMDLLHTDFQDKGLELLQHVRRAGFVHAADSAGALAPTRPFLGFGAGFFDFDNDGWLDIVIANGHVWDTVQRADPAISFAQSRLLLRNRGNGQFEDLSAVAGEALTAPAVGRGVAFGDYDNDGDVDVLVNNNGGSAMLLRNEVGNRQHWLRLRLVGRAPNCFAVGARATVVVGDLRQLREVRAGNSYASASDFRLHFGLGRHSQADKIVVRWPGGRQTAVRRVRANREVTIRE